MKYIDSLSKLGKVGKAVGEQLTRKAKKPLAHYKAIERAEKVMDAHEVKPKRAPMNVPKIEFTAEEKAEAQKVVEEMRKPDEAILSKMKDVYVTSTDPQATGLEESAEERKLKLPKNRIMARHPTAYSQTDTPRGLVTLPNLIDILDNHAKAPEEFTVEVIAEKFKLRESDLSNLLNSVCLLPPSAKLVRNIALDSEDNRTGLS